MGSQLKLNADSPEKTLAREIFQPSQPIRKQELLVGRAPSLKRTLDALGTPGRSPFIYGVRGVGKTSLAQTAAYMFNWSGAEPIYVACLPETTFASLVSRVSQRLMRLPHFAASRKAFSEAKVGPAVAQLIQKLQKPDEYLTRLDVSGAVDLFNVLAPADEQKIVVVIDELDVASDSLKSELAYLIKQIGDQECRLAFVFAGIAENANELLQHHASASRYIATIELQPLKIGELHKIVVSGFERLQVQIPDRLAWRIACLSDGFAHFTHLLCLKAASRALDADTREITADLFAEALTDAIEDSAAFLRDAYDHAVQKYQDKYELVLWAAADHWELYRSTEHLYDSYLRICQQLDAEPQDRSSFSTILFQLKQPKHAAVLKSDRRSWYRFTQGMMRGYCRLVAQSKGVELGLDYMKTKGQ